MSSPPLIFIVAVCHWVVVVPAFHFCAGPPPLHSLTAVIIFSEQGPLKDAQIPTFLIGGAEKAAG